MLYPHWFVTTATLWQIQQKHIHQSWPWTQKSSGVIYICTPTGCSVHGHNPGIFGATVFFPAHTTTTTVFWTLLNVIGLFLKKYVHQHLSQTLTIANRSFNSVRLLSPVHTIRLWACTNRDPKLFQVVSAIDLPGQLLKDKLQSLGRCLRVSGSFNKQKVGNVNDMFQVRAILPWFV